MCSSPSTLDTLGELHLAVKRSAWPPAAWIHEKAVVGSEVALKIGRNPAHHLSIRILVWQMNLCIGGDFYYPNERVTQPEHNILLVAGGIGINPIFSILQHVMELKSKFSHNLQNVFLC